MRVLVLYFLFVASCFLCLSIVHSETLLQTNSDTSDWKVYVNKKYSYQIKYPKNLELWLTGPSDKRDGSEFRIAQGNLSLPSTLDVHLYPGLSIDQIGSLYINPEADRSTLLSDRIENLRKSLKDDSSISLSEIVINGIKGVKIEHLSSSSELEGFFIFFDGVAFNYRKMHGFLNKRLAEKIVTTFRLLKIKGR